MKNDWRKIGCELYGRLKPTPASTYKVSKRPLTQEEELASALLQSAGGIHCGRFIAQQIAAFETEWLAVEGGLQRLDKLHAMAERETKLMMALARSMRLTHQSQYKAETAYTAARSVSNLEPPWDKYGAA